jgi:hypothetical protein
MRGRFVAGMLARGVREKPGMLELEDFSQLRVLRGLWRAPAHSNGLSHIEFVALVISQAKGRTMRTRTLVLFLPLLLVVVSLHAAPTANSSANFTLSNPSHIPGTTLKPGDYKIEVVNRLSDRVILRVEDAKGKVHETFLGVPNNEISKPKESGPIPWANPAGKADYLKGWYFPSSRAVIEFVYPKAEAVSIATANPAKVPAVDPASQGMVADKTLSQDDMQLLTLWLLSLQEVGPGAPAGGIKAERYQLTSNVPYKPSIKALPHTASWMPVVWIAGFCTLLAAFCLRRIRLMDRTRLAQAATARGE